MLQGDYVISKKVRGRIPQLLTLIVEPLGENPKLIFLPPLSLGYPINKHYNRSFSMYCDLLQVPLDMY